VARLAILSYHTSPLTQPGTGDGGGMNVYVRELATALARLGVDVDVFTRRDRAELADVVRVEPGLRVRHVNAGPARVLARHELVEHVDEFADEISAIFAAEGRPSAIHANYWLSGLAGHRLKHEFDVPLITTFHTLEHVKAATFAAESPDRAREELTIVGCSDAILASCDVEADQIVELYGADPARLHIVALGVEHAFFAPGHRPQARRALGFDVDEPLLLFIGRIQRLKGVELALETQIELRARGHRTHLAIIGGPSGLDGRLTLESLHHRVEAAGVLDAVTFVAPQPHELLSTWFRAADATLVPSLAESFGLVALESTASGTPVVASRVGGLTTLVDSGSTGLLVDERSAATWADAVEWVLDDERATCLSTNAVLRARSYTWRSAAAAVAGLADSLRSAQLVTCP
jgi:D-inositol-3-phosphate glycosyltransferase